MPPRSRPPRPFVSPDIGVATVRGADTLGSIDFGADWFPCRVTGTVTGGYSFVETMVNASGAVVDKPYGRKNSATDPAVPIDGATLAVGDKVQCRRAPGSANQRWELGPKAGTPVPIWKDPAYCCTTAALPANTYANGSGGVGATLTANSNGALPNQDSQAPFLGMRIIVGYEVSNRNGLYVVTSLGSASTRWVLTRAADCDSPAEVDGAVCQALFGLTHIGIWELKNLNAAYPTTVGFHSLGWLPVTGRNVGVQWGTSGAITPDSTWIATPYSVTLPHRGWWLVTCHIRTECTIATGATYPGIVRVRLYNTSINAQVGGMMQGAMSQVPNMTGYAGTTICQLVATTIPCTVRIEVMREYNANWLSAQWTTNGDNGSTPINQQVMNCVCVGPF
ncbi:hypothetical protein VT84_30610 [Gemmata sp. SH-PL17]|uniref:hypothetical protein n=1 Tax=Gemmata sp. SH-PL17 TaxID=1630693 RepID=UPI00078D481A|nr:hypothetical protein [Gemmata sp. SH-PL17]AMV28785.1 hypothetical protein VT84_30610 [Gemmata sp. SH-PL17]